MYVVSCLWFTEELGQSPALEFMHDRYAAYPSSPPAQSNGKFWTCFLAPAAVYIEQD